ncbi:cation:proton antiporter [Nitriliruptoraceae bacterium ZYF776]|nr:cation:proton antiporter [Profundirhabdus halotolerans]
MRRWPCSAAASSPTASPPTTPSSCSTPSCSAEADPTRSPSIDLLPLTDPIAVFAVLFLLVLFGPMLAERLRLPSLVGLIVMGMLVGPNVAGIVSGQVLINALGFVGLLYLMFQGGLDLDLDGFNRRRRDSIWFGVLTFVLPMVLVTGAAVAMGVPWLAALIVGSALTSHTPLTYTAVSRAGLARNPAVTATLGATLIATVAALLVLAVAAAGADGDTDAWFWVRFAAGAAVYLAVLLLVVPRVTRWFFRGLAQDRDVRLTYLLSGMGLAAVLAGVAGIEPIVGAFLAGLAFNRFVPDGTVIADRIEVLGRSLFIPAFLISTGMMLDPVALVTDRRTLLLGAGWTATEVASKYLAATAAGRKLGFSRPERGLMFSLSVGQAAGALAAVVVGQEVGLLGDAEVNAVILVIMVSALIAGLSADRSIPNVEPPPAGDEQLGRRVVVPVSNPQTVASLMRVAGQVAAPDSGAVVAVNVLPFDAGAEVVREHRQLTGSAEKAVLAAGAEVTTSVRIDASTTRGVLHSVVEQDGTCLVMGWKGFTGRRESLFGTVIDRCVSQSPVPVLVCRPGSDPSTERVVLVIAQDEVTPVGQRGLELSCDVAARIARQGEASIVVVTDLAEADVRSRIGDHLDPRDVIVADSILSTLANEVREGDVVVTAAPSTSSRFGQGARRVAQVARERTVVVAVPH